MGAPRRRRGRQPALGAALQRPDPPRLHAVPEATSSASASCRSRPAGRRPTASASSSAASSELGFVGCNLNPDPSGGYWTAPPLTDRALVSALREAGRARRAGDGARQRVLQSELPRDRRALHQRRHDRVHAVPRGRSVQGFPDACASSFRTAAAPCRITGGATAGSRRT